MVVAGKISHTARFESRERLVSEPEFARKFASGAEIRPPEAIGVGVDRRLVVTLVSMVRAVSTGGFRRMAFRYDADHRGRKSNGVTRITTPRPACCALCGGSGGRSSAGRSEVEMGGVDG